MYEFNKMEQNNKSLFKTYLRKKVILKRRAYTTILLNYFCADITGVIVSFLIG